MTNTGQSMPEDRAVNLVVRDFWDDTASAFDGKASHRRHDEAWRSVLEQAFGPGPARRVMDLGTGTGALAIAAAQLGHDVVAVDGSSGMLAIARARAAAEGLAITFNEGFIEQVDPKSGPFDIVTLRNVLWTVEDPAFVLGLARTLLRSGGLLVVSDGQWSLADNEPDYDEKSAGKLPLHDGIDADGIEALLEEQGFDDIRFWHHLFAENPYETLGAPPFFVASARA